VGRRTAEGRIGNTAEAFDELTRQKRSALRVAPRQPPAVSLRLRDVPIARRAAPGGSTRRNATQVG
jgi:hypothetical protein